MRCTPDRRRNGRSAATLDCVCGGRRPSASSRRLGAAEGRRFEFADDGPERHALDEAARTRGTTPANWVRSLAIVHRAGKPQWNPAELDALRELAREVAAIGNNVNQIAHALNVAVYTGQYPPDQGAAAHEAAELVPFELRQRAALMTGNFDHGGLPDAQRPTAAPGAVERADTEAQAAEARRKNRP